MGLLYEKYSNPLEFMNLYINQGRLGEFVENIMKLEGKRKLEEIEKINEDKMWEAYLHSFSDKSYVEWKADLRNGNSDSKEEKLEGNARKPKSKVESLSMTNEQVEEQKNKARNILNSFNLN